MHFGSQTHSMQGLLLLHSVADRGDAVMACWRRFVGTLFMLKHTAAGQNQTVTHALFLWKSSTSFISGIEKKQNSVFSYFTQPSHLIQCFIRRLVRSVRWTAAAHFLYKLTHSPVLLASHNTVTRGVSGQ